MSQELKRIDPENCGCVDCMTGYSKPAGAATYEDMAALLEGKLKNATGLSFGTQIEIRSSNGLTWRSLMSWDHSVNSVVDRSKPLLTEESYGC